MDMGGPGGAKTIKNPYAESVWVMSAIRAVCLPVTSVPLMFGTEGPEGMKAINDERLSEYWAQPAVGPSGPICLRDLIYLSVAWLKLAGESFWVMDDMALVPFPEVQLEFKPFIPVRPDRMRHIAANGRIKGWEFTDADRRKHMLLPEQVIHLKLWNPYDDYRGLGEYEAARIATEADYYSGTFARNVAAANGDQGVYVVSKSGVVSDEQRSQMVAQLREKREMQQRGMFKPIFLTGDITIEDPKVKSVDGAFAEMRHMSQHEIYIAFGVPPSMADVVASYSVGSASDYYRLIRDTCTPAGVHFCEGVEQVIQKLTGDRLEAWFDWSSHPVMKEIRKEQVATAVLYWDRGLSWQTVNGVLDLGLKPFEGWDVAYLPFSVTPADQLGLAGDVQDGDVPGGNTPALDPVQDAIAALEHRAQSLRPKSEMSLWRSHMAKRRSSTKLYEAKIKKVLLLARSQVLSRISAVTKSIATKATALELTFDLSTFASQMEKQLGQAARVTLSKAGAELLREIGSDDPFHMSDPKVTGFLSIRENKIKNASGEIHSQITDALKAGIDAGDTMTQLADRVRSEFNGIANGRARTIAATESGTAYEFARQHAMEDAGIESKRWLSAGDERVRESHARANGQTVAINDNFDVGGSALDHPCDPDGPPGEVINCRCVSLAVLGKDES